jgi:hypothetical protein
VARAEEIEFVNRSDELEALRDRIPPHARQSTLTFLRSPSGYGKTRLTDRLLESIPEDGPTCVVVDPAIKSKSRSDRIYAWYFVQRAAEPDSRRRSKRRREFRTFPEFLRKSRRWRLNWQHAYENVKGTSSAGNLLKLAVELGENLFKQGRYRPEALLQDDSGFATAIAADYVLALATYRPTLFIIRECQNIDAESLRFFLGLAEDTSSVFIVFEYTNSDGKFSPDHEKILFEVVSSKESLLILDLLRLDSAHFRYLLQKYAAIDQDLEVTTTLRWDGNLRIIKELQYRMMVRHPAGRPASLLVGPTITGNLDLLSKRQRLILAFIVTHVEAIQRAVLLLGMQLVDSSLVNADLSGDLQLLATSAGYITDSSHSLAVANEDLAAALLSSPAMMPLLRMTESVLRDLYLKFLQERTFVIVPVNFALRQAIALCARTGDIVALRKLVRTLDTTVRSAHDQTLYVNLVAEVILDRQDLSTLEMRDLVDWASSAAYEVGDFPTAVALLERLEEQTAYTLALLACSYGEVNRNAEAIDLSSQLAGQSHISNGNVAVVSQLIDVAATFALGQKDAARALHAALRRNTAFEESPLFGFVLRYTEIIEDYPSCIADLMQSVVVLRAHGFRKAAAYSQLSAAAHLAYSGQTAKAQQLIAEAEGELIEDVRDRQISHNNYVVVALLSPPCDLQSCIERLATALFSVRDDFSRLVIENNRLICYWLAGDMARAEHCADVIGAILTAPNFGNRDVFWTTCFNAWSFFSSIGNMKRAEEFRAIPPSASADCGSYSDYWKFRFGESSTVPAGFEYLAQFRYHPEYLSHWLIDHDGLAELKAESAE